MNASCVLCGELFSSIPDLGITDIEVRNQKQFAEIGRLNAQHLHSHHRKTIQKVFDDPNLVGPLPIPALIGAVGMCAQNAAMNAYLKSEDATFQELNLKLVDLVTRAMRQVEPAPSVSLA